MTSSLVRGLRSVGYSDAAIVSFATSILAKLCRDQRDALPDSPDLEFRTGLLCGLDFEETLDFEIQRSRTESRPLGLIAARLATRTLCSASERFEDERRLTRTLTGRMRTQDTVGRASDGRLVLSVPGASPTLVLRIATELSRDVAMLSWSRGTRVEVRAVSWNPSIADGQRLLLAAESSPPLSPTISPAVRGAAAVAKREASVLAQPVGLALCGGAAWAAAHIGVLSAIEKLGGSLAGIGATSAGALVAAMYGIGMDASTMLERFESFATSDVMAELRRSYARVRIAGRRGRSASSRGRVGFAGPRELAVADDELLRASVEHFIAVDRPIESLRLPLALCATDLQEGSMTYFSHGSLHDALMAACAVPGLFRPQRVGSQLLVDGSLAGELPVAATRSLLGGAPVIGSHVRSPAKRPASYDNGLVVAARLALIRQRELVCEQGRMCAAVVEVVVDDL
ncbi:MAG: patatin-like phospholipase family protein, partial [Nannocystaceae bacterium]|nr:patatin-like phospholipase family protein [Nannocystaceae bacterium]